MAEALKPSATVKQTGRRVKVEVQTDFIGACAEVGNISFWDQERPQRVDDGTPKPPITYYFSFSDPAEAAAFAAKVQGRVAAAEAATDWQNQ